MCGLDAFPDRRFAARVASDRASGLWKNNNVTGSFEVETAGWWMPTTAASSAMDRDIDFQNRHLAAETSVPTVAGLRVTRGRPAGVLVVGKGRSAAPSRR